MTDNTQPEALALADEVRQPMAPDVFNLWAAEAAGMIRRQHARIAELEAVGAGGVQALSAVPAGWKLVPVEPTNDMQKAADEWAAKGFDWPKAVYRAMLAASPTPPAEQATTTEAATPKAAIPKAGVTTGAALGGVYAELPRAGAIGYASVVDVDSYVTRMTIGPRLPGVRDIALWTTDQLRDFADRTHALRMEPAVPKAAPAVDIATVGELQAFEAWYKQDCVIEGAAAKMAAKAAWKARAMLAASPTPPAEQQARWVERWHGSGGKEFWEGWSILNAANREMIAHLGPDVDPGVVRDIVAAHNEALCGECAGTGGRWCPACAGAAPPAEQQAAPKAAPGEQNTVPTEWLEQAYREGWAACRDAETIGEEAEDWAFGNSTANSRMIDAQQAAPQQEAQEPYPIDADPQGIRAVVADAITGALAFGAQGANPPPEGHWLTPFWGMAREEAMRTQPASVSSDTLYLLRRLLSNQHTLTGPEFRAELEKIVGEAYQQEAQEPCQTCAALARTVMCDQVSFDRKPDCYGIRQVTNVEGVEEWEDIRTSPDVAREEATDMMATGRGEIYEVVPLWATPQLAPQPAPAPLSDDVVKDAARWRMLPAFFAEYQIDAMKLYRDVDAAIAAQGGKA